MIKAYPGLVSNSLGRNRVFFFLQGGQKHSSLDNQFDNYLSKSGHIRLHSARGAVGVVCAARERWKKQTFTIYQIHLFNTVSIFQPNEHPSSQTRNYTRYWEYPMLDKILYLSDTIRQLLVYPPSHNMGSIKQA